LFFTPALRQIVFFKPFDVEGENPFRLLRQPLALRGRLQNEEEDDWEEGQDRENGEVEFAQLLLVDLAGKESQFGGVLHVPVDGGAMPLHFGQ
jgi:hypothetical protein